MGQRKGLAAVLVTGHLRHDLSGHIAGRKEAVRLLDQSLTDHRAVLQHILQVDKITVVLSLSKIIGIVEMDDPLFMRPHDLLREKDSSGQVLAYFPRHVISLGGVDHRVLVGVLLVHFLIDIVQKRQDPVVRGVGLTGQLSLIAVAHVFLGNFIPPHLHDACLHHVLDILHVHCVGKIPHLQRNVIRDGDDLIFIHLVDLVYLFIGRLDGVDDLLQVEVHLFPVSLDHFGPYLNVHVYSLHIPNIDIYHL